ncbi:MAG: TonB-dependent receptor [Candidatus Aminicenantes bacterium]|jgi:hypothetical protein
MKRLGKISLITLSLLMFLCSLTFPQSQETGAIEGTVTTPEGEALPGVEVTISSDTLIGGNQSMITNQYGRFRFPALPPGTYEAEARLEGFTPQRKTDLRISVQFTLSVNFVLHIGSLEETIEVIGEAPIIDVKDSQLNTSTMEKEFLMKLPSPRQLRRQVTYAASSVGERGATPYGASESLSNNFLIDGVKTNSPEAGEPEVNLDYDSIEEMKMMGQGTNAEYDGFSGITVSAMIKSGGNNLEGLGTFWFQLPSFHSSNWDNYRDEGELYLYQADWDSEMDFHLNFGGPFIQDKLWWYMSAKYNRYEVSIEDWDFETENGWRTRFMGKLTWQIGANDRIFGTFDYALRRDYNIEAGPYSAPETWATEKGWQYFYNANFLHIFSNTTFLEAKIGGYNQDGKLDIDYDTPWRFDEGLEYLSGNFWEIWEVPRTRNQLNAAVSHHAEEFIGTHDFKFGGEFEYSYMRNYRGYPGGRAYIDIYGDPYLMIMYSPYLIEPKTNRYSLFLQDQWAVSDRLTVNWGLRWNRWRGSTPTDGTIFKPKDGFAPRLGITLDLFGDGTTALKAHYGRYYHGIMGMWFGHWSYAGAYAEYIWNGDEYELDFEETWDVAYTIDPDLKYPYVDNFVIGIERELGRDMVMGVSYINRSNKDFIDNVNLTGMWEPYAWTHPELGETFNVYQRINPGENEKYVTNPYEGQGRDIGAAFEDIVPFTPTRKYWGLEFTFRKRFSNNWQFMAAYTYSKAQGSNDNSWGEYEENRTSSLGASVLFLNPNWAYNAEGTLTRDHPHILKLAGSVVLPLEITLGAFFQFYSGQTYNRRILIDRDVDPDQVGLYADDIRFYGEEKGSFRYPSLSNLDIRLEKFFTFGEKMRIGLLMDMYNVLNSDTVDYRETRIDPPDYGRDPFGFARGIVGPRTFKFGLHFEF